MREVHGMDVLEHRLAEISDSLGKIGTAFHPDLGETLDAVLRAKAELDAWKRNHWPAYAWEPVILVGGRTLYGTQETPRDWYESPPDDIAESITMRKGVSGAKPLGFCLWLFSTAGLRPDDELVDLFPGSGAVARAWETYCAQAPLAFPAEPENEPFEGMAA